MSEPPSTRVPDPDPKRGLVVKLCEVMAAVGYTQKTGWNESQRYHYVTEADIAEKVRPELAKRNIFIFPSLVKHERTRLERVSFKGEVKQSYATDIIMRWTIVDGDTGQERVCEIPGCSESPGDKGVYVAMTGSEKYLLVKGLLLPTGDDPENDANEPTGSKEAAQAIGKRKAAESQAKIDERAKKAAKEQPEPIVLFSVQVAPDLYEITGDSYIMQANADILLKHGIKHVNKETGKAVVRTSAEGLDKFKFAFEERGGMVKPLKPVTP